MWWRPRCRREDVSVVSHSDDFGVGTPEDSANSGADNHIDDGIFAELQRQLMGARASYVPIKTEPVAVVAPEPAPEPVLAAEPAPRLIEPVTTASIPPVVSQLLAMEERDQAEAAEGTARASLEAFERRKVQVEREVQQVQAALASRRIGVDRANTLGGEQDDPAAAPAFVPPGMTPPADGLATLAPTGDPAYAGLRGDLAADLMDRPKLGGMFALHPALTQLGAMYDHNLTTTFRIRR